MVFAGKIRPRTIVKCNQTARNHFLLILPGMTNCVGCNSIDIKNLGHQTGLRSGPNSVQVKTCLTTPKMTWVRNWARPRMSIEMHPDLHIGLEEKLAPVCENFFHRGTASLSHLRTMLPESSSCSQPAQRPNHAT